MAPPFEAGLRLLDHVGDAHRAPMLIERTQRRVDHRNRDITVACGQFVGPAGAAAFRKHLKLGAEHVALGHGKLLALGITILAALNVEGRALMDFGWRIPGAEIDLVMHESFGAEHAYREHAWRGPRSADI